MSGKTIFVKFIPYTNAKPSRFKAYTDYQSLIVSKDGLEGLAPEKQVAEALCKKMGWEGTLIEGRSKNETVFVFDDTQYVILFVDHGRYWLGGDLPLVKKDDAKKMHRDLAIETKQALEEGTGHKVVIELF